MTIETWTDWQDTEDAMSADIMRYINKKTDHRTSDFRIAILSSLIESLTQDIRTHVKLKD